MIEIQRHRGPDNSGYYIDNHIAIGHNRLSLVDINSRSDQPYKNDNFTLIYNGEIYNFLALKTKLIQEYNIEFQTTSDTEVLFYALIHWGIDKTLSEIKGMFAFVFYDFKLQKVWIARDKIGIKPLFYGIQNGVFYCASEIKALNFACGFTDIIPHFLTQAVFGIYENSRKYTAFRNVYQLEPGKYIKYDLSEGKYETITYFRIADWVNESEWHRFNKFSRQQITDHFEYLFDKAVHSMILADAPMGAFVSGGIDSSLNAAIAHKYRKINLYTANILGKFSEFNDAQLLAETLGVELNSYAFEPEMFIHDWVKTTWFYEAPIVVHTNAVPFQNVSHLANSRLDKAVITGEGSDELFLGYPRLLTKKYDSLIRLPFHIIEYVYKKIPGLTRYLNLNKTNYLGDINKQTLSYEKQLLEETYKEAYGFLKHDKSLDYQLLTPKMIDQGLHCLLWRNDRMGMMHSIESRFPYLDDDLMQFAMNLPVKFKIGRTNKYYNWKHPFLIDKAIVRNLGERYLPARLVHKKKEGFPMYGHMYMTVKKDFFAHGFWQNFFEITDEALTYMIQNTDPYLIAKLASVEIWGSLFVLKRSIPALEENANKFITIKMK